MSALSEHDQHAYYRAALAGLRHIEARLASGRRFCSQADARWGQLHGSLTTADRIDLLVRDASAQWACAFAPRAVFDLRAVAEDEPFGAEWSSLDPVDAEELWRTALKSPPPVTCTQVLDAVFSAWDRRRAPFNAPSIAAADRFVVAGPSAIAALIEAFALAPNARDLDWADQVLCIASGPLERQLAALAAALLNSTQATQLTSSPDATALRGRMAVISEDALAHDTAAARLGSA